MATKQEIRREFAEALAAYLEPISLAANTTRIRLGLPPVDITERPEVAHQIDYFEKGWQDGSAGYYDTWYQDKVAFRAYQAGNFAGRTLFHGEIVVI